METLKNDFITERFHPDLEMLFNEIYAKKCIKECFGSYYYSKYATIEYFLEYANDDKRFNEMKIITSNRSTDRHFQGSN